MVNSKHAFWQALIVAIAILSIGIFIGFILENSRADNMELILLNSEINLLDEQIRNKQIEQLNIDCEIAMQSTYEFADKIYFEALKLEDYQDAAKFTETIKILHKRYDLLRMMLWLESMQLKEKCEPDFHTIVYIFEFDTQNLNQKAKQSAISRLLLDIKNKHGQKILLIPIAGNLELESVNLTMKKYKITKLPTLIIDENIVIEDPSISVTFEQLETIMFEKSEDVVSKRTKQTKIEDSNTIHLN